MHMKNPILFGLIAILLLGGTITPVLSQSSSDSVVINEVEINPLNGAEFVELYNPTSQSIDISEWSLTPSMAWKNYEINSNTIIEPNSFLAFPYKSSSLKNFGDTVSLINNLGELVDQTPLLIDLDGDAKTWQRSADGIDTDSISDWELKVMTPFSSNGKIIELEKEMLYEFIGKTDKIEYTFDDDLIIFGSVSERLFKDRNQTVPEIIKISIQGTDYFDVHTIYPDRDLNFSTIVNIKKVHGFNLGNYTVDISYGTNSVRTDFVINEELITSSSEIVSEDLVIFTDKESYSPGDTATLFASTTSTLEYAGLEYVIFDPNGKKFSSGTIYPNPNFSIVHKSSGGQIYPFSTQVLMHGVNPVFGTYEIQGTFKTQDPRQSSTGVEINTSATFQLVEEVITDEVFSLSTDKEVYSVNDTIFVTGRSNHIWTENVELEVQQTGVLSRVADSYKDQYIRPDPFTLKKSVALNGDGKFEFQFNLIENFDSKEDLSRYLGDYRLTISEYFGTAYVNFKVVENPESFVDVRTPLGLQMDKSAHVLGTAITLSGKILDYEHKAANNFNNNVKFTITDSTGKLLMSEDRRTSNNYQYEATAPNQPLTFTAIPDIIGNFQISAILNPIQFDIGEYTVIAHHSLSKTTESIAFEVITAQSEILSTTETEEPLIFVLCTSTANIETIQKDLKQIGKGEVPPSMDSIDCDGITDFQTGEKLIIKGEVVLKPDMMFDGGYYAQNQSNYVELSIPYPHSLIVSTSYRTVPDAGVDYHGGGGSGSQCREGPSYTVWTTNPNTGQRTSSTSTSHCEEGAITKGGSIESERHTGYDGQAILREVTKNLTDMRLKAYPDAEGNFVGIFDIRAGVFVDGIYKLKASYSGYKSEQTFLVNDNSLKGGLKPELTLDFDKNEYLPGDVASIFGKINNVYYYDPVSIEIITPADVSKINCLVGQSCELANTVKKIRVSEGTGGAALFMNYKIPLDMVGKFTVIADTHFGEIQKSFFVVNESDVISSISSGQIIAPSKIIEKFNRISDDEITITLDEKDISESTFLPRVIQGSLFTSARGEESIVSLEITTIDGQCVIGQNSNCLVSESTRKPGEIYSIVSIDDINYKIRYSGNDVRLEKFSIVPEDSDSKINIENWNVKIVKDQQPTRFYYKVSYIALE